MTGSSVLLAGSAAVFAVLAGRHQRSLVYLPFATVERATQHVPTLAALQSTPCTLANNSMRALRAKPLAHTSTHCGSCCTKRQCRFERRWLAQPGGNDYR